MADWKSRRAFAEQIGCSVATVARACWTGAELERALDGDGKLVDAEHEDAVRFLEKQRRRINARGSRFPDGEKPSPTKAATKRTGFRDDGDPDSMAELGHLTLDEIGTRFGSLGRFELWLKPLKLKEEIREKRLKNLQTESEMIDRDLVRVHVLGALEDASRRLLLDSSRTIARLVMAEAKAGKTAEDIEKTVRDLISKPLTKAKQQAARKLRGIEGDT